ncbi:hypothetical protein AGMMS50262_02890 [Bacteroidia bacterium]|nr:hypothetical protein AGMMS50262_02890 [Bacteroidia bacterium]
MKSIELENIKSEKFNEISKNQQSKLLGGKAQKMEESTFTCISKGVDDGDDSDI